MVRRSKRLIPIACTVQTQEGTISFSLKRSSRRRTIVISIDEHAHISVYAPKYAQDEEIHQFIQEKAAWIVKKVEEAENDVAILKKRKFDHGQVFLFLGKKHPLSVIEKDIKRSHVEFDGAKWIATISPNLELSLRQKTIKEKMLQWYKRQASEILGSRIFHYARTLGVEPKRIAIRTQKQIWGSCDYHNQTIHLNWQIILSPLKVVDYVVVHELCHLLVPNHSKRFWKKVEKIMPDYHEQRKWLKTNSLDMVLP